MVDLEQVKTGISDAWHVALLIALILIMLGVLTWTGIIRCNTIPGWCAVYDPVYMNLTGKKEIAIVYGAEGMGDPVALQEMLRNPKNLGVQAQLVPLSSIRQGNLDEFDLVIVEKARAMSTKQLKYFIDYAAQGGKLIWTGDAGTQVTAGDMLLYADDVDENASHTPMNPWARGDDVDSEKAIRFDFMLSVQYIGNYCEIKECAEGMRTGALVPEPGADHPLIEGLGANLQYYGDFAVVKEPKSIGAKRVLSIDQGASLDKQQGLGELLPLIVTTGLGEKIAYYAAPPEMFFVRNPYLEGEKAGEINRTPFFAVKAYHFYRK